MTSVSYSIAVSVPSNEQPETAITKGTSAPGAGVIELRINAAAAGMNTKQAILALDIFKRRLEGVLGANDITNI